MLWYWLMTLKNTFIWLMILSQLQTALNNSVKQFTKLSSNKILFNFGIKESLNLLCVDESDTIEVTLSNQADTLTKTSLSFLWMDVYTGMKEHWLKKIQLIFIDQYCSAHIDVKNVVVFVSMIMKDYYDKKHTSQYFAVDNMVHLYLHCSYILSSLKNRKLEQQFVNSLHITEQIKKLVYQLDVSSTVMIKGQNEFIMPSMSSRTTDYMRRQSWGTAHATQGWVEWVHTHAAHKWAGWAQRAHEWARWTVLLYR